MQIQIIVLIKYNESKYLIRSNFGNGLSCLALKWWTSANGNLTIFLFYSQLVYATQLVTFDPLGSDMNVLFYQCDLTYVFNSMAEILNASDWNNHNWKLKWYSLCKYIFIYRVRQK